MTKYVKKITKNIGSSAYCKIISQPLNKRQVLRICRNVTIKITKVCSSNQILIWKVWHYNQSKSTIISLGVQKNEYNCFALILYCCVNDVDCN